MRILILMVGLATALTVPSVALAKAAYMNEFAKQFPEKAKDKCKACHEGAFKDKKFTAFGNSFVQSGKDFSKMAK